MVIIVRNRLISFTRTSPTFVRKKAALTLLRLYRKHPEVIPAAEWALRIVALMDDMDLVRLLSHLDISDLVSDLVRSGCGHLCYKSRNDACPRSPRCICRMLPEGGRPAEQSTEQSCAIIGTSSIGIEQLVVEHEYMATYAYYKVPSPWLQVKLLRLLQYYPPTGEKV